MFTIRTRRFFGLLISFSLFVAPLPLSAIAEEIGMNISEAEVDIITQNPDTSYIYLADAQNNIINIVSQLCELDDNINSPLHKLREHIDSGFSIAEYDVVIEALAYAESLIHENYNQLDLGQAKKIIANLDEIIDNVMIDESVTRAPHVHALVVNRLHVDRWLHVRNQSQFDKHIRTKQGITASGHLKVGKSSLFKDDVSIEGTLSATNAEIENLTLSGGLSFTDLSVVDLAISGTLSVNDLVVNNCINELCVDDSSVVDQTISGVLTVNDIVIENCIDNLCIDDLSVVDQSVSGTLSINDAVIQNLTLSGALAFTDISATDATISGVLTVNDVVVEDCITNLCATHLSIADEVIQNFLRFQDSIGGEYVGLQAPSVVPTSYTLTLPSTAPAANQVLRANAVTPTNLEWGIAGGGGVTPSASKTIYVTKYGNDTTGNGSFELPYLTLSKAITVANSLATGSNPITIDISTGMYVENNSAGPLTVTASGISIVGASRTGVTIIGNTPANDLLLVTSVLTISDMTLFSFSPSATGITFSASGLSSVENLRIFNFLVGIDCIGGAYTFDNCIFLGNGTALNVNNVIVLSSDSAFIGAFSLAGPAVNAGVAISGSGANVTINGGLFSVCATGLDITNNARVAVSSVSFRGNASDIIQTTASQLTLSACTFEVADSAADIDMQISGPGTITEIIGCEFNGKDAGGIPQGTGIAISDDATVQMIAGHFDNHVTGIQIGLPSDTSSTSLSASGVVILNCTNDIIQEGSTTLNFNGSTAASSKISINDATNVVLAFFDLDKNSVLTIGSTADVDTSLLHAIITPLDHPHIDYLSSLYSTQAIGYRNGLGNPATWFAISDDNTSVTSITTDRTKNSDLRLVSDEGAPVGGISALRGWDISKNGSTAELSFKYQNTDIVGQSAVPQYTVLQLDGVNNQLQLPTDGTQIIFASDTNLYRSNANVLKTDDNFIVDTLTPNRVVVTDPITNQLSSSAVTALELGYLSGVTSPIQTQLDGKVNKSGDTMTGTLSATDIIANNISVTDFSATDAVVTNLKVTNMSVTDATVTGTLSINDVIIQDLSATTLSATDAIIQNAQITTLSATDAVVQNQTVTSFSATDAIIQNETVTTLSATDAIIQDLTIQDLTVTNCIANFCVNTLSVVDESVSGTLSIGDEVIKNFLRFSDALGGEFVGIKAPTTVPISYTVSLPSTVPTANQILRANVTTPTNLEWVTEGGSVAPSSAKMIYVAKYGNDTTGNGSFNSPYLTLSKAISTANGLASAANPITIVMMGGIYVENNSTGPLTITAAGISIVGDSTTGVIISPSTPANNLLLINNTTRISNITLQSSSPLATGISFNAGSFSTLTNVRIINFLTGVSCAGGAPNSYGFNQCLFVNNVTALLNNNSFVECNNCTIFGVPSTSGPATNTGISVTGSAARLVISGGLCGVCNTGISISNGATTTISSVGFRGNAFDVIQTGPSAMIVSGCSFELTDSILDVDIQISGIGAIAEIISCEFNGKNLGGTPEGIGILISDDAFVSISGGTIHDYETGIQIGVPTDVSSTILFASSVNIRNCVTDILQQGSATLNFNAGTADGSKISINDSTNVTLAFFDLENNNALNIGSKADQDTILLQADIAASDTIGLAYKSSLYSNQAIGLENLTNNPTSLFIASNDNAHVTAIATDRFKTAGLSLFSDEGSPIGGMTALRGWNINKNSFTAELAFNYQNSDIFGQPIIPEYTVMQLDGVNNQLQLPTVDTRIIFAGDTNLYRSSANVLQTDSNLIVNTLTPGFVVVTDPITNQLISSPVTDTELAFLSGTVAALQAQLDNKVSKTGDIMTGTLELPAGLSSSPSLIFTDSTATGLSAPIANTLSFSTNGNEVMSISATGIVSINAFTTDGVVHNNASGVLSSSLIVDADIANATISNAKLATITSSDTPGNIVVRDLSGNFAANMITLDGAVVNPNDAATKAYVDFAVSTGIIAHTPALVVSIANETISGLSTIDGVSLATNDRVLLTGQTNPVENGLWLAQAGAWIRPADFNTGNLAGQAYVLILSGTVYAGSSWLCSTPLAIIDTDPISFSLFTLPDVTTGANVGAGIGQVFKNKTGVTLNFRTLLADPHITITNNTDDITFSVDATSANTPSTIIARDASGNFFAGTITANLTGTASNNVLRVGDTMTGALQLPAGTTALPSLKFTGSTTTGLSASVDNLSFSTTALERMKISSTGVVSINNLTSTGIVHNDSSGNLSTSLIVNADVDPSAGIVDTKLATISTAGKVANSATTATSANVADTIVARDSLGNFSANTIVASLMGAASDNVLRAGDTMTGTLQLPAGTTALPSLVFTGSTTSGLSASAGNLSFSTSGIERMKIASGGAISIDAFTSAGIIHNDASGNLSSSLIVNADVASAAGIIDTKLATISTAGKVANSATTAASANTANAIVARDGSGNFSAGTITANLNGNAATATTAITATTATNFTGSLSGDVTGTQGATVVSLVGGQTAANVAAATVLANAATSSNTASTIVRRDASGNFSAGTITANLNGNATTATTATNATNFTGSLSGDVTGTQGATVVSLVGGQTAANVAAATVLANAATSANTVSAIVRRSAAGSFSTSEISVTDEIISNSLTVLPFNTAGVVHNDVSGLLSSSLIVNADVDPAAAIVDTKLATISTAGKVANSATTATSLNTANTIVARDASGNFNAGTIIANLTGSASNNVLKAGDTMTGTLQLPAGTTATPSLTFTGSTTTGLSASAGDLSFSTNATERMKITSSGVVSINGFTSAGVVHNDSSGNLSTTLIVNADVASAAGIVDTKLATISTAGKVANSATTATSANTANAIVARDASGNFSAGTITANLNGNATTATNATNFTGSLSGDVTGTQGATVVSLVGGQTAANVAAATVLANAATSSNTASTIVRRDASGGFSAGAISVTDEVISNSLTIIPFSTAGVVHNNASGLLSSSLIVNADVSPSAAIVDTKLATISTAGKVANSATTATSANTASSIVARDGSGNFSTTMITLTGTTTNATDAATKAYVDAAVGAPGTNLNTPNTTVKRDGTGSFAAQVISLVDTVATGNLVFTGSTSTSTTGNITKGGNRFIHNFGTNNTFMGINAGNFTMTGTTNTAMGVNTLFSNTLGSFNTVIGSNALASNTTGNTNTAIGQAALFTNTIGSNNTAIGNTALGSNITGNSNVAIGADALVSNTTGSFNTAVGVVALSDNTTGVQNVAIGNSASEFNTIGIQNVSVGNNALQNNLVGIRNVSLGYNSLFNALSDSNTAVGASALNNLTTGGSNISIGANSGANITTGTGNIYINANASVAAESNTIRIGTLQTRCFIVGIRGVTTGQPNAQPVLVDSQGQLGQNSSSERFKHNIQDIEERSENIFQLRPVSFVYNADTTETMQYGLIAEEVDEVFPTIVVRDENNQPESVLYHVLPVLLLNELKKQQVTIENLKKSTIERDAIIQDLMNRIKALECKA